METTTNYIVILWLLPVTIFIIIPLSFGFIWLIIHAVNDLLHGKIPLVTDFLKRYSKREQGFQRRREERSYLGSRIEVELSHEERKIKGVLTNISPKGFCVEQLTDHIHDMYDDFSLILIKNKSALRIKGVPRWLVQDNQNHSVGFRVIEKTPGWEKYCMM